MIGRRVPQNATDSRMPSQGRDELTERWLVKRAYLYSLIVLTGFCFCGAGFVIFKTAGFPLLTGQAPPRAMSLIADQCSGPCQWRGASAFSPKFALKRACCRPEVGRSKVALEH